MSVLEILVLITGAAFTFVIVFFVFVLGIVHELEDARDVRAAKKADIGDGVTLQEGIRAYFGEDGVWGMFIGIVRVRVGMPEIYFEVGFERTGRWKPRRTEVYVLEDRCKRVGAEDAKEVLALLAEAAKSQRTAPKP